MGPWWSPASGANRIERADHGRWTFHSLCGRGFRACGGGAPRGRAATGAGGEPVPDVLAQGAIGANGLLGHPALMSDAITPGGYQVTFLVGDFYRAQGGAVPSPDSLRWCLTGFTSPMWRSTITCHSNSRHGVSAVPWRCASLAKGLGHCASRAWGAGVSLCWV